MKKEIEAMSLDDLLNVKRWTDNAIEKRENEQRVPIWMVSDSDLNEAAFLEQDYDLAVQAAIKIFSLKATEPPRHKVDIEISKRHIRESEVTEMLEWWADHKANDQKLLPGGG